MQPAPATEQASTVKPWRERLVDGAFANPAMPGYVLIGASAEMAARDAEIADWRATQAERVQSSESIDTAEFRELIEDVVVSGWRKDVVDRLFARIDARRATASKAEVPAVACNAALRAAPAMPVDADARDAARYRWLRDSARSVDWSRRYVAPKATSAYRTFCRNHPQQMDDDIDVAIAANTKQGTP